MPSHTPFRVRKRKKIKLPPTGLQKNKCPQERSKFQVEQESENTIEEARLADELQMINSSREIIVIIPQLRKNMRLRQKFDYIGHIQFRVKKIC